MSFRPALPALACSLLLLAAGGCGASRTDYARQAVRSPASLVAPWLASRLPALPSAIREGVLVDPIRFAWLFLQAVRPGDDLLRLVDKRHALPAAYEPDDLVELDRYAPPLTVSRPGHRLRRVALESLLAMSAAAAADGVTLVVSSVYRSFDYQEVVYGRHVARLGQAEADRVSARPGTSQHQLGTAIDFGCICDAFATQPPGLWLAARAWEFGFSLSYPEGEEEYTGYRYEPWHFRYIGRPAALLEQRYFGGSQQRLLEFIRAVRS